jgi:hypothetical protein
MSDDIPAGSIVLWRERLPAAALTREMGIHYWIPEGTSS